MVDSSIVYKDKTTALLAHAIQENDLQSLQKLIDQGADLNILGDHDTSLLMWALFHKREKAMALLLENGANPSLHDDEGQTVLHLAAAMEDPRFLTLLINQKVDPNLINKITKATALFEAILANRNKQFKDLLAAGINPNLADNVGDTALHIAASIDNAEQVLDLLEAGADPTLRSQLNVTFQKYFFMMNEAIMTEEGKEGRKKVKAWLKAHNIALETQ